VVNRRLTSSFVGVVDFSTTAPPRTQSCVTSTAVRRDTWVLGLVADVTRRPTRLTDGHVSVLYTDGDRPPSSRSIQVVSTTQSNTICLSVCLSSHRCYSYAKKQRNAPDCCMLATPCVVGVVVFYDDFRHGNRISGITDG